MANDQMTNLKVEWRGDRYLVSIDYDGARLHFWQEPGHWDEIPEKLYKNPPPSVERGTPGYYDTRYLYPQRHKAAREIFNRMAMAITTDMLAAARAAHKAEADRHHAVLLAQEAAERVRNAGPELAAALQAMYAMDWRVGPTKGEYEQARAALVKAGVLPAGGSDASV